MVCLKKIGSELLGIPLSMGPAQAFGVINGVKNFIVLMQLQSKIKGTSEKIKKLSQSTLSSPTTGDALLVQQAKLQALKNRETETLKSLEADIVALAPFLGAFFARKVLQSQDDKAPFIEFSTKRFLESFKVVRQLFYPNTLNIHYQSPTSANEIYKQMNLRDDQLKTVRIPVMDPKCSVGTRSLDARHFQHDPNSPRTTVIIFHGNADNCDSMANRAKTFYELGYDVLVPTMGGYPGSDPIYTSEESTLRDVEAAKVFLEKAGVAEIGIFGYSIGGSLAFQAGATDSSTNLKIKFVMVDRTFNRATDVAANHMHRKHGTKILKPFARGCARAAFPKNRKVILGKKKNGSNVVATTDGLDNEAKAKKIRDNQIPLYVIYSTKDEMMHDTKGNNIIEPITRLSGVKTHRNTVSTHSWKDKEILIPQDWQDSLKLC
jgi:esterase/lipase